MKQKISKLISGFAAAALTATLALVSPMQVAALSSCPTDLLSGLTPYNTNYNDTSSVNVGVKFRAHGAPYIRGVKFYKGVDNTGTHVAHLGELGGSELASATFTSESSSGWQSVNFGSDVPVYDNVNYIVWVSMPNGHYAVDGSGNENGFLNNAFGANGEVLSIPQGTSGYYSYTSDDTVAPSNATYNNYWVSPVAADSTAPGNNTSPSASDDAAGPFVSWSAAGADSNGTYTGTPAYTDIFRSDGTTSQRIGRQSGGLSSWLDLSSGTQQDVTARPGTTYTYTIKNVDFCGNVSSGSSTSGLTTASQSLENIFSSAPTTTDSSIERQMLGMHWQTNAAGQVWGARIYRAANTMPAPGATNDYLVRAVLWDNDGTELAGTFLPIGNNQSGWIDVRFDSPVSVSANHDYVIGYYAGNGQNVYTTNVFTSAVSNGSHLTARADGMGTPNGVYAQGSGVTPYTFPTNQASSSTWYGVDVNFYAN